MKGLTVDQYALANNMNRATVYRQCSSGKLEFYFDGTTRMIKRPKEEDEFLKNKKKALLKFEATEYKDQDFLSKDKILCPHCAEVYPSENIYRKKVLTCGTCKGSFNLNVEIIRSYSTVVIGQRLTFANQFPEEDI